MIILSSASKIVFILLSLCLCIFTGMWLIDPKDFVSTVGMVFVYYFWKQSSQNKTDNKE